jgi:hypothetical protein
MRIGKVRGKVIIPRTIVGMIAKAPKNKPNRTPAVVVKA